MTSSHAAAAESTIPPTAVERLLQVVAARQDATEPVDDFRAFEERLHAVFAAAEREVLGQELARLDINVPAVIVEDIVHTQVLRGTAPYLTRAGVVHVERSLYRAAGEDFSICPLELRAGIVEGYWTPWAAMLAVWAVAHLTPAEAEELFDRVGGMTPSRSSLDRLPRAVNLRWEDQREVFESAIRAVEAVPEEAVAVAVSLDGIMVPMKDGERQAKRARARAKGKETRGPTGYREASCGTITFYDKDGDRLETRGFGRMPQKGKATLKAMLAEELKAVLAPRPDLLVVGVADGAKDNWTYLEAILPQGAVMVLDFFHAADHLKKAMDLAHGKGTPKSDAEFQRLRLLLRDEEDGVYKVINALAYQVRKHPRRKKLKTELRYFRRNRKRMDYARLKAGNLPIGSGVVEAANKTLVTVRMKRAGSRWSIDGGQAVLTFRSLSKSDRFDHAWDLLAHTYKMPVEVPQNVIPLRRRAGR